MVDKARQSATMSVDRIVEVLVMQFLQDHEVDANVTGLATIALARVSEDIRENGLDPQRLYEITSKCCENWWDDVPQPERDAMHEGWLRIGRNRERKEAQEELNRHLQDDRHGRPHPSGN